MYTRFAHRNREVHGLDQEYHGNSAPLYRVEPVRRKRRPLLAPKKQQACKGDVVFVVARVYKRAPLKEDKKQPLLRQLLTYPSWRDLF